MGSHWEVGKLRSDVMGFALGKKSACMWGCPGEWIGGSERGRRITNLGKKDAICKIFRLKYLKILV